MGSTPKAPSHLTPATRKWWEGVVREYVLEEHHLRLLTAACEAWDRSQEARILLAKEGIVVQDRFDQPKEHPAVGIERHNRAAFASLLRELALDVDPPAESRPPAIVGRAGLKVER